MNMVDKPSAALRASSDRRFEPLLESPGRGYSVSALLAIGVHAGLIFCWQRSPHREPPEYGVVSGESAIEVALIAAQPAPQETVEPAEPQEAIAPHEQVEKQETPAEIAEKSDPEPLPSPVEPPIFNFVPETPKPENPPKFRPAPTRAPTLSTSKSRAVDARTARPSVDLGSAQSGSGALASATTSGSRANKPAYLYNPHPPYPEAARRAGLTGVVMLRVSINERGRVSGVSVARSSGHSLLDDRARTAVQRWIFRPARQNGKPVATHVDVPVRFSLDR